jgi:hypothetical protein
MTGRLVRQARRWMSGKTAGQDGVNVPAGSHECVILRLDEGSEII